MYKDILCDSKTKDHLYRGMFYRDGGGGGGRRSPAVACWASDHWVASSNPLGGKFRH